jgi:hypothetical protein
MSGRNGGGDGQDEFDLEEEIDDLEDEDLLAVLRTSSISKRRSTTSRTRTCSPSCA